MFNFKRQRYNYFFYEQMVFLMIYSNSMSIFFIDDCLLFQSVLFVSSTRHFDTSRHFSVVTGHSVTSLRYNPVPTFVWIGITQ